MEKKDLEEYTFNYKELLRTLNIKGKLQKMEVIENEPSTWNVWLKITVAKK